MLVITVVVTVGVIRWVNSSRPSQPDELPDLPKSSEVLCFDSLFEAVYRAFAPRVVGTWRKERKLPKLLEQWISSNIQKGMWRKVDDTTYRVCKTRTGKVFWVFRRSIRVEELDNLFVHYLGRKLRSCGRHGFATLTTRIGSRVNPNMDDREGSLVHRTLADVLRIHIVDFIVPELRKYFQHPKLYKVRVGFYFTRQGEVHLMGPHVLEVMKQPRINVMIRKMTPALKNQMQDYQRFLSSKEHHLNMHNQVNFPFVLIRDKQGLDLETWGSMLSTEHAPGEIPDSIRYVGIVKVTPTRMKTFFQFVGQYIRPTDCSVCSEDVGSLKTVKNGLGMTEVACNTCIIRYLSGEMGEESSASDRTITGIDGNNGWVQAKDGRVYALKALCRIPLVMKLLRAFEKRVAEYHASAMGSARLAERRETNQVLLEGIRSDGATAILCPMCAVVLVKSTGCNAVVCTQCLCESCFGCGKQIHTPNARMPSEGFCACSRFANYVEPGQREDAARMHSQQNAIPRGMVPIGIK